MSSQKGGDNTEENVTPAPVTSPALSVKVEQPDGLDLSRFIQITDHDVLSNKQGNFRCKCKMKFRNLPLLKLHIHKRVEKPRFKCHPCNKVFFFLSELRQHQKSKKCGKMTDKYFGGSPELKERADALWDKLFAPVPSSSSSDQLPQTPKQGKKKGKGSDRDARMKLRQRRMRLLREDQKGHSVKSKRTRRPSVCSARSLGVSSVRQRMSLRRLGVPPQTSQQHSSDIQIKSKTSRQVSANCIAAPSESNGNGVGTSSGILDQLLAPVSSSSSNQFPQTKQPEKKGKGGDQDAKRKFRTRRAPLRQVQNGRSVKSKRARGPVASLARSLDISSLRQRMSSRRFGVPPQTSKLMPPQVLEIEMEENQVIIPVNNDERERNTDSSGSDDTRSLSQLDEMELLTGIMNEDQHENGDSIGLTRNTGRIDYVFYGCFLCDQDFRMLQGLKDHLHEWHKATRSEVRCAKCGEEFGSCKTFHEHRHQVHYKNK